MKTVRLCLMLPLLLAAAFLSAGCSDNDGNYEQVDIQMEGVDLHGTVYYTRSKDNSRHEIVKLDLREGRLYLYPAPEGASTVTDYRDGTFLLNGVTFAPRGGPESDVVGFAKESNTTEVQRIETGYLFTGVPMLSSDGVMMAFHGRRKVGDPLTVGIYEMEKNELITLPCPGKICSNARWSSNDKKLFFIVDDISAYYLDMVTGSEINLFSLGEGRAIIGDILSYKEDVVIISILNGRLRDGGSLVKVEIGNDSVTTIHESRNCSIAGISGTAMINTILYTKGCYSPPSQGVYLYNLETGEEVRLSNSRWMAHDGGWVE